LSRQPVSGTGDYVLFESRIVGWMDMTVAVRIREELIQALATVEVVAPAIVFFARERGSRIDLPATYWIPERTGHFGLRRRIEAQR